jgi:hypothetical protein
LFCGFCEFRVDRRQKAPMRRQIAAIFQQAELLVNITLLDAVDEPPGDVIVRKTSTATVPLPDSGDPQDTVGFTTEEVVPRTGPAALPSR